MEITNPEIPVGGTWEITNEQFRDLQMKDEEFKKVRGNIIDIGTQIEYDLDEVLLTLMFGEPKKNN